MDRLKAMETFVRVVETGSLSRAAKALGLPRSSVTMTIQRLEQLSRGAAPASQHAAASPHRRGGSLCRALPRHPARRPERGGQPASGRARQRAPAGRHAAGDRALHHPAGAEIVPRAPSRRRNVHRHERPADRPRPGGRRLRDPNRDASRFQPHHPAHWQLSLGGVRLAGLSRTPWRAAGRRGARRPCDARLFLGAQWPSRQMGDGRRGRLPRDRAACGAWWSTRPSRCWISPWKASGWHACRTSSWPMPSPPGGCARCSPIAAPMMCRSRCSIRRRGKRRLPCGPSSIG